MPDSVRQMPTRNYPPSEVACHFVVVRHGEGWAVRSVESGDLLAWEDGSPRVCTTQDEAELMADGTLRVSRAAMNGFLTGLLSD